MRKKSNLLQRNSKGKNIPTQQEALMGNNQARQRSTDTQATLHQHPDNAQSKTVKSNLFYDIF